MSRRILVVGAGFAGMWAALSAARLVDRHDGDIEVALVAPEPVLVMRPRLYEANAAGMIAPLGELFAVTGIRFVQGTVETIHSDTNTVDVAHADGRVSTVRYDSLILATGSQLFRPDIPGLRDFAFSIDRLTEAAALEAHCHALAQRPDTPARNTVAIGGGGFTGIEIAAEMPARLRNILGADTAIRVVLIEQASDIGPDLGPGPRPVIQQALRDLGVECRLGAGVAAIDAGSVTTSTGERIETDTVVWTAGVRASPLTAHIPGERDGMGRLLVDRTLRASATANVFAAGDTASAATDDAGHRSLMSCQHALLLGKCAGNNAAAQLLGVEPIPYSQVRYGTGLDLGPWGAVQTTGWERRIVSFGAEGKVRKRFVNGELIYPPKADRAVAFAAADPAPGIAFYATPA